MKTKQTTPLRVVYSPKMVAEAQSYSPSAGKPSQVVADWQERGLVLELIEPEAATVAELSLAHARAYVEGVLNQTRRNGFGNTSESVALALPYTTGAMLTGARLALDVGGAVAAPCSGFHHAGWGDGAGFCTFNGLMVTALSLIKEQRAGRVLILDCDQHYGDGTDDILRRVGGSDRIRHFTAGRSFHDESQVEAFFETLTEVIEASGDVDVVLYQAGADPHIDDPLGGWLTTAELRQRDAIVFEAVAARKIPIVWNLAGGYQRDALGGISPVLKIHHNTALEHVRVFCKEG